MKKLLSILSVAAILCTFAIGSAFASETVTKAGAEVAQTAEVKADEAKVDDGAVKGEAAEEASGEEAEKK